MNIFSAYRIAVDNLPIPEAEIPESALVSSLEEAYDQILYDYPQVSDGQGSDIVTNGLEIRALERVVGLYGVALFAEGAKGKSLLETLGKQSSEIADTARSQGVNALRRIKLINDASSSLTVVATDAVPLPDNTRHTIYEQAFGLFSSLEYPNE